MFVKARAQHGTSDTCACERGAGRDPPPTPGEEGDSPSLESVQNVCGWWHLGTWFDGEHGSVGLDLINLRGLFHPE